MQELKKAISRCRLCSLRGGVTQVVVPSGSMDEGIMFVGEAPGRYEDESGIPFVGDSGKWLQAAFRYCGLQSPYVTNSVKCRTQEMGRNRTPTKHEVETCSQWLRYEVEQGRPMLIATLGSTALTVVTGLQGISKYHGLVLPDACLFNDSIPVFPLYHPAVLIYDRGKYESVYREDLLELKQAMVDLGLRKGQKSAAFLCNECGEAIEEPQISKYGIMCPACGSSDIE